MSRAANPRPGQPGPSSSSGRPIMALLDLLGRRWALRVLWELRDAPVPTFRALQAACGGVSSSVLSARLAELSDAGIVERVDHGYVLTQEGRDLVASLVTMNAWAARWAERTGQADEPPQLQR
jgi:DNA-binding HxlR family transcriptional regulator